MRFTTSTCRSSVASSLVLACFFGAAACQQSDYDGQVIPIAEGGQSSQPIIGGFGASTDRLNAIGTIVYGWDYGDGVTELYPACTASLIGPTTIITAKHCTIDWTYSAFALGPDSYDPIRVISIIGWAPETQASSELDGYGIDVTVAHLAEPVVDEADPMPIALLEADSVGERFVAVGFGVNNNNYDHGTRLAGSMTLQGVEGRIFEILFGSLEEFKARAYEDYDLPEDDPAVEAALEQAYEEFLLIPEYEALFGNGAGDAQACSGDSGGPIVHLVDGVPTLFGVMSWAFADTVNMVCDWATGVATFGPAVLELIEKELACPLIPEEGMCDGTVAVRCSEPDEGERRILSTECALLGLICGFDDNGEVACVEDPCEGIPELGYCDGDVAVRCSGPDEGERRVLTTDCSELGVFCGSDEEGQVACVDEDGNVVEPQVGCENFCGGSPDGVCWCDPACVELGDCCPDYEDKCVGGSCDGHCGDTPDGLCWCDEACVELGDCCEDYSDVCADTVEIRLTPVYRRPGVGRQATPTPASPASREPAPSHRPEARSGASRR